MEDDVVDDDIAVVDDAVVDDVVDYAVVDDIYNNLINFHFVFANHHLPHLLYSYY